jgi:[protein-PII] uridylyltransferase
MAGMTLLDTPARPDDLILPHEEILDTDALARDLAAATRAGSAAELRRAAVPILAEAMQAGRTAIAAAFAARPFDARPATRAWCWLTDCLVLAALDLATQKIHPLPNPTESERIAVCAVGGYGRGEMAPFSDVDLLFLTPYKITPWAESVIESMLYILWDLRLKVGHASRTIRDCLRLGAQDFTIRTALLENRCLGGDAELADRLDARLRNALFTGTEREFTEAKLAERDARHEKQGERYMVEPNVKEGKGGLRDLQSLFWIAKYVHHVREVGELVALGTFTAEELGTFTRAENFLWAVRCHLHLVADRANDQLTFDMQVEVARRMGYSDRGGRRGVEIFMQDYFRHATAVGDLTRIFLTKLEAAQQKAEPLLQRLLKRRKKLRRGYIEVNGRLAIADEAAFLAEPLNLLRLFEEALRTGLLIHPDAMLLVTNNLPLIGERFRNDPAETFPRPAAETRQPRARAPAHERAWRALGLHPRIRADPRDDAVQHVSSLHGGRTHHPVHFAPGPDRAARADRGIAGLDIDPQGGDQPPRALCGAAAA